MTNSDGSYWVYQYDSLSQVTNGFNRWSDGVAVAGQQFGYAFDTIGNRQGTTAGGDQAGGNLRPASYTADNLNRYSSRSVPGAADVMGALTNTANVIVNNTPTYRKGAYYQLALPIPNTTGPVFQSVTNLAAIPGSPDIVTNVTGNIFVPQTPENFGYDLDGNLTSDGRWTYTWDAENRLSTVVARTAVGPQQSMRFEYDSKGRRIGKKVWNNLTFNGTPATEQKFLYDGWNLIAILNSAFVLQTSFVWGLDLSGSIQGAGGVGGLLEISDTANGVHFAGYDGNGDVAALVKAIDGTVSAQYEYGPFGEVIRATGPVAKPNPFRFSTKFQDDETDLRYYGYRYYNASTGRWLSRDPFGEEGASLLRESSASRENLSSDLAEMAFVGNDSLNSIDYLGGHLVCRCGGNPPVEWAGSVVNAGSNARHHKAVCSFGNNGEIVTFLTYTTCAEKKYVVGLCYNCAKWECRMVYTYMCSKHRNRKGQLFPSWRTTNVIILNDCNLPVPPGEY